MGTLGNTHERTGEVMKLYKILTDGKSCAGGTLTWPLPRGGHPGAWVETQGNVVLCRNGIHVVGAAHVLDWDGNQVWEVEVAGDGVTDGKKWAYPRARLLHLAMDEASLRHFAVACAARVLPIFERKCPDDMRVRECLSACGPGSDAAARAAACAAAKSAAVSAARSAAARSAARSAAGSAAGSAAWSAAAKSAAVSAAWSARDARAAARAAAWAAAWAAEHRWQIRTLRKYLADKVDLAKPVKLPAKPKLKVKR